MTDRRHSPHRIISTILVVLALLSTTLATLLVIDAYQRNQQAGRLIRMSTMTDRLNTAAAIYAIERGMTSGLLGAPDAMTGDTQAQILNLRDEADTLLTEALRDAEVLRPILPESSGYPSALTDLRFAHADLLSRREQLEPLFKRGSASMALDAWFATTTRLIENIQLVERIAVTTLDLPHEVGLLMFDLGGSAWRAAEYMGRERGLLAYYISAKRIVPEALRTQLINYRGVVDNYIATILHIADHTTLSTELRQRITAMNSVLDEDYAPLRRQVLLATEHGVYPVDGTSWLASATRAIDTLLMIGRTVTQETRTRINAVAADNQRQLLGMAFLLFISLVITSVGLYKTHMAAELLSRQEELAGVTLNIVGDGVITTNTDQVVRYLNPVAEELTGWKAEEAIGRPLNEIYNTDDNFAGGERINPVAQCIAENRLIALGRDVVLTRRNGEEMQVQDSATPMRDNNGRIYGAVLVFYDATSLRNAPHLLSYHARHDPLTGLLNRREFEHRLDDLIASARELGEHHMLCFIDLDNFKPINDTCGHEAGDKLLQQITYLLSQRVRGNDTLARIGGDEFAVLLEGCGIPKGQHVAQTLCDLIQDYRFTWQEQLFEIGASIGIAPINADVVNAAQVMNEADAACYAAKELGRNRIQLFEPENLQRVQRRGEQQWLPRLQRALDEDHFTLYAQPIIPSAPGHPSLCEILVRLRGDGDHLVHPGSFLPAAERHQLTPDLDRWVIRNTLTTLSQLPAGLVRNRIYTINLSNASLSDETLFDYISEQLTACGVSPEMLCFEIAETTAATAMRQVAQLIDGLHELGCMVALDDFGTGLSSLAHLKNLNVDYLKIAAPFVREIARDDIAAAMVGAIGSIAHLMGIKTIAEYVTTPDAAQRLRTTGVDYLQGYAIAKPQPLHEAIHWLAQSEANSRVDSATG